MMNTMWRALEEMPTGIGVAADWRHFVGEAWPAFQRGFLDERGAPAESYRCPRECGCAHRVVTHADGRIVAVCECDPWNCDDLPLTAADVVDWEFNRGRLARAVGRAFGLERREQDLGLPWTQQVATVSTAAVPVVLTIQQERGDFRQVVADLAARWREGFILFAPTSRFVDGRVQELLSHARARCFDLETHVTLLPDGTLQARRSGAELFAEWMRPVETTGQKPELAGPRPRYSLRKQMGVWQLVFDGRKGLIEDERGVQIVAYLMRNPPREPVHAVPLETKVWAREWVETTRPGADAHRTAGADDAEHTAGQAEMDGEVSGARLDKGENILLKRKFRELLEIIEDTTLPQDERDAAQEELDAIHASLDGAAGRVVDGAAKAADRVRKAIKRLHSKLAKATDEKHQPDLVLRDFAAHLLAHLIIPSSRFNRGKGSRNRAGVAGTSVYEPPPGVVWED